MKISQRVKKYLFITIVLSQGALIVFLLYNIYSDKNSNVFGKQSTISTQNQNQLRFPENDTYQHYYEPEAHQTIPNIAEWLDHSVTYTTNNDGLYERSDYSIEKTNAFRIMTIGDSHTQGLYVNTEDSYPERLEDILNSSTSCSNDKYEVINLGVPGYDLQYSTYRFNTKGKKYEPDLVIWFVKYDDFMQSHELLHDTLPNVLKEASEAGVYDDLQKQHPYFEYIVADTKVIETYGIENLITLQINSLKDFRESFQGKILFIMYSDENVTYKTPIKKFVEENENTLLFEEISYDDLERFPDTHPTEYGYQTLAKKLLDYLKAHNLIPCDK